MRAGSRRSRRPACRVSTMSRRWPNAPGCWRVIRRCKLPRRRKRGGRSGCAGEGRVRPREAVRLLITGKEQADGGILWIEFSLKEKPPGRQNDRSQRAEASKAWLLSVAGKDIADSEY